MEYPTLHTERLTEREREVVAAVLEDRLRDLFELVMRADNEAWDSSRSCRRRRSPARALSGVVSGR
jgi:hypothetical protein